MFYFFQGLDRSHNERETLSTRQKLTLIVTLFSRVKNLRLFLVSFFFFTAVLVKLVLNSRGINTKAIPNKTVVKRVNNFSYHRDSFVTEMVMTAFPLRPLSFECDSNCVVEKVSVYCWIKTAVLNIRVT